MSSQEIRTLDRGGAHEENRRIYRGQVQKSAPCVISDSGKTRSLGALGSVTEQGIF